MKKKVNVAGHRSGHPGQSLFLSRLFNIVARVLYGLKYSVRLQSEKGIPAEGPVLILAKHWALADVPLGKLAVTRDSGRHLWCVMKESLARGPFGWFLLRQGGIPVNRAQPDKSRHDLLLARKVLEDNHVLCIFPEQTTMPGRMGRGRAPGFRFIAGQPNEPIAVITIGFHYTKRRFRRTLVDIKIGPRHYFTAQDEPEAFLHERMLEMARLSGLEYTFEPAEAKASRAGKPVIEQS